MISDAVERYFDRLAELAPKGYSFGFHIRYSRPRIQRSTYAEEWNAEYSARGFILNDPTVIWGMTNRGSSRWSDVKIPDTMGVMAEAARFGLRYGAVIGVGDSDCKSLGSCARADREFEPSEISEIEEIVASIHGLIQRQRDLKPHQKDALRQLAAGRTYDQACENLGISRTALKNRLSGARRILGAATNSEAVWLAIDKGEIESLTYTGMAKGLTLPGGMVSTD